MTPATLYRRFNERALAGGVQAGLTADLARLEKSPNAPRLSLGAPGLSPSVPELSPRAQATRPRCATRSAVENSGPANGHYRGGGGLPGARAEPFAISAKGSTLEEALAKLRAKIQMRLKNGTELVGLEVGAPGNPWVECAGMFKDDPWIADWVQSMAEYRQQVEDDPTR